MLEGSFKDALRDQAGRLRWQSGWRPNRIVHPCDRLLAALMKRDEQVQGILYLAVGEGEKSWDAQPPTPAPSDSELTGELLRWRLTADHIIYLDGQEQKTTPTNRLQVTVDLPGSELTTIGYQPLREFGLFGGDATEDADSGYMIDYVIHPRIDLTPDVTLRRQIQLTFQNTTGLAPPALPEHWLGDLSLLKLDGVGDTYAAVLTSAGISTIYGIARCDPLSLPAGLPAMKRVELQAKARLTLCMAAEILSIPGLLDRTVWEIITMPVEALVAASGASKTLVERSRQQASTLQATLDNQALKQVTIGELTQPT